MNPVCYLAALGCVLGLFSACTSKKTAQETPPPATTQIHSHAGPETREIAEREMLRRQQATDDALRLIEEGDQLRTKGDLEGAIQSYQRSLDKVP